MAGKNNGQQMVTPQAGGLVKQEVGGATQMEVRGETAAVAVAAAQEALVKARCALAKHSPRDIEVARTRILKDCDRPLFAERAVYSKPVGKKQNPQTGKWEEQFVEGPSVRLAEAIFRHMGNMFADAMVVADDYEKRIVKVMCMDLETNATDAQDVTISKTVERRKANDRTVVSQRMNSYGDVVYTVVATEDELLNKVNSAVAKMRRNKIIELSPIDIVEEAMNRARQTTAKADAQDPDAAKRRIIDAFAEVQVSAADLREWLGHDLDKITPAELAQLRKIHAALDNEETSWAAVMDARGKTPSNGTTTAPPPPPPPLGQQMAATAPSVAAPVAQPVKPTPAEPSPAIAAPAAGPVQATVPAAETPVAESAPMPVREISDAEKSLSEAFAKVTKRTELIAILKLITALPSEGRKQEWRQKFNQRMQELS